MRGPSPATSPSITFGKLSITTRTSADAAESAVERSEYDVVSFDACASQPTLGRCGGAVVSDDLRRGADAHLDPELRLPRAGDRGLALNLADDLDGSCRFGKCVKRLQQVVLVLDRESQQLVVDGFQDGF